MPFLTSILPLLAILIVLSQIKNAAVEVIFKLVKIIVLLLLLLFLNDAFRSEVTEDELQNVEPDEVGGDIVGQFLSDLEV